MDSNINHGGLAVTSSPQKNMQLNYQQQLTENSIRCHVVTTKAHQSYDGAELSLVSYGDIFIEDQPVNLTVIAQQFSLLSADINALYQRLSGQFWLFLLDKVNQQTYLVNDHFGMQPCFYTVQNQTLYISDSLKQLTKLEELSFSIAEQSLFNYLYFHCIPSPNTIFSEAAKLEPGKAVCFDSQLKQQASLLYQPDFATNLARGKSHHQDCLATIDKAVTKHAFGEVGAFLSGGLDSSSVAGMLSRHQDSAKTFSVGFNIDGYDETPYAQLTANHFNTDHQVLYLQPEQAAEEFIKVAQYFDEPFGNSSAMATYFCAKFAKQHGVNKLLAGDGGDELFAGNERYAKQKRFQLYQAMPGALQSSSHAILTNTPLGKLPGFKKGLSYVNQARVPLPDRLESYNFFNRLGVEHMFDTEFLTQIDIEQPIKQQRLRYHECSSEHMVDKMLYLDWKFTLADNDLVKVGRMCDMAGVEVRYPLLDKALVDFSCTIPADVKLPGHKLRDFYKNSCRGFLADDTLTKSKHGFGLPFGVWLKENQVLRELALDSLLAFKKRNIVKDSLIDKVLEAHNSIHASYYGELIWIIVVLELWLQQ